MSSTKVMQEKEVQTKEDQYGNITSTIKEKTTKITALGEPDYIKLYTNVWCEFNRIPIRLRDTFLELASRMSYANSAAPEASQIVFAGKPTSTAIMEKLNLKQSTYNQYLRELIECKAIRRVNRSVYQINPNYAGRGQWKYNPRLQSGGIEDLIATFDFVNNTVETKVIWADDKTNSEYNKLNRKVYGSDVTVKRQKITQNEDEAI